MKESWRRLLAWSLLFLSFALLWCGSVAGQNSTRPVKRVEPIYPELARKMKIHGVVRIALTVAPNGTVKDAKVLGGHPLLVEASLDAVRRWRYAPASEESTETAVISFVDN